VVYPWLSSEGYGTNVEKCVESSLSCTKDLWHRKLGLISCITKVLKVMVLLAEMRCVIIDTCFTCLKWFLALYFWMLQMVWQKSHVHVNELKEIP